jgi:1-acyl-sn-glycerol-3-phosphate acyltransferase
MADPTPRVVRLPGMRRARGLLPLTSPVDVARRLAALERQVEKALGSAERRGVSWTTLERALDRSVDGYGLLRRALTGETTAAEVAEAPLDVLYRWWWRIEVIGRERLPRRGPVLVVANRGGSLMPYEAFMLARAFATGHDDGRIVRPLVDEWLLRLPVVGPALASLGGLPATTAGARSALGAGAMAIAFPEGTGAVAKPFSRRYRLAPFARGALLRLAAEMGAAIVPVAVIGADEVHPVLWRLEGLGHMLGLPALPITPALLPLPTKWTVHVGEPLHVPQRTAAALGRDVRALRALRVQVRERLQGLVSDGLRRRRGLFV